MTAPGAAPANVYSDYVEFFDLRLAELFARNNRLYWCPEWQKHPEAATVIEALWVTWEIAQRNPGDGMAVWMRDFAYPLLFDRLAVDGGTFSGCSWRDEGAHNPDTEPLPRV
jgi:hypothetical protein